jgi:glycosyltransferase involved in cell wall biosynthesis
MRTGVAFDWEVSSYTGWGVYGLNLALAWAQDPEIEAICTHEIDTAALDLDALGWLTIQPCLRQSKEMWDQLKPLAGGRAAQISGPLLRGVNAGFGEANPYGVTLKGKPNLAVCFLETPLEPDALERARAFDLVIAGCRWNEALLRAQGMERVTTILQGIDPSLFHPAPRRGLLGDRFVVFSGGKLERRKGQDLVVAAFKLFAERHPDALLIAAWRSPWPKLARSLDHSGIAAPVPFREDGQADARGWIVANGLKPSQFLDLGMAPNAAMPRILREADVALFPNRCEGGTNLVAMEAMACGVPAILAANTGHLDLIEGENCYALSRQAALTGPEAGVNGVAGWGESDVEEILEALERAYADREDARRRGLAGARTLSRLTWAETARRMKATVLPMARG